MSDQLTASGIEIDTLDVRIARVKNQIRVNIADNLDLSSDQPSGQFVEIFCEEIQQIAELIQEVHTAFDPSQATGNLLSMLSSLTGTSKQGATYGTVTLTLNLDAATTVLAGALFQVSGEPDNRWETDVDVTSTGAGNYDVAATAANAGAIQALSGTITVIVNPQAGLNSCTNALDAQQGENEETDTELRLRREQEVFLPGAASTVAIKAQLSDITGIISVFVDENTTTVPIGLLPASSIECIIWDGAPPAVANADIVAVIFEQKPASKNAYGKTIVTHVDSENNPHQIGFTRVTVINILCDITLVVDADYVGDAIVQTTINDYIETTLGVGEDVLRADITQYVNELDGVANVDLSALKLSIKPAATATVDIVVARDEKAMVETLATDITVTT
jgi:uncharacterized phage protein gp47/JayE